MGDCCWGRRLGLIEPKVLLEVDLGGTGDCWISLLPQLLSHPGNERMVTLCGPLLAWPVQGICLRISNWSWSLEDIGLWDGETSCYSESVPQNHSWGQGVVNPASPAVPA